METVRNFEGIAVKFHVKFCTIFRPMLLSCIISSSSRYLMLALPQKTINCKVTRFRQFFPELICFSKGSVTVNHRSVWSNSVKPLGFYDIKFCSQGGYSNFHGLQVKQKVNQHRKYTHKIMLNSYGFVIKVTELAIPNMNNFLKTAIRFSHDFCPLKMQKNLKKASIVYVQENK